MPRNTSLAGCLVLAALTAACKTAPPPSPPDTRAADLQAFNDVLAAWTKDMGTKDAGKYASYFAEDGCTLYPGAGIVCGREAIKAQWVPYLADPNFAMTFEGTRQMASKGGDMTWSMDRVPSP